MPPSPKRHVRRDIRPMQHEVVRVLKNLWVAVRRSIVQRDRLTGADFLPMKADLAGRRARETAIGSV